MNTIKLLLQYLTAPIRFLLKGPTYLIAAPRRMWGMRPPARAAILVGVFLVLCTITVVTVDALRKDQVRGDVFLHRPGWMTAVLAILIATPTATYYLVGLWLEGEVSQFPDVDRAWDAGLAALAENGIDVRDLPLYILLGLPSEGASDALVGAARIAMNVSGSPKGPAPLHWYASEQAIYLAFTGLGRLGRLSQVGVTSANRAANPVTATMVVGRPAPRQASAGLPFPSESAEPAGPTQILGTLVAGGGGDGAREQPAAGSSGMSRKEAEEQTARLAYAVRRLRKARQPYCADNGVLSVVTHAALSDIVVAKEIPEAIRSDLATLAKSTRLSAPVVMLISGMEADEGFTELVRRVGVDRARSSRFGKGFDVWNAASDENLDALSSHACGSFEDWVYTLFASDDGIEQRTNGRLYAMLCQVRRHLQPRLRSVLVNGYAAESDPNGDAPRLFGGCYFAATGRQGEQQAFVRSVFEKLDQLSEDLQWSDEALHEESVYRRISWGLSAVNAVGLVICIGLLIRLFIR